MRLYQLNPDPFLNQCEPLAFSDPIGGANLPPHERVEGAGPEEGGPIQPSNQSQGRI